jgi:hypothetical protein
MSVVAQQPATQTAPRRGGVRGAVPRAQDTGLVRRFAALLGMLVLLGGFVGMHQMSGSPLAHGSAHTVVAEVSPHAAGEGGTQEEAPSGTGHGEMQAMCLMILAALLALGAPGLRRRVLCGVLHLARVVAPWWRRGSALAPPSLVALGISRR